MDTKSIIWAICGILGALAALDLYFQYFKASKVRKREQDKFDLAMDIKKRENDALHKTLTHLQSQMVTLKNQKESFERHIQTQSERLATYIEDCEHYKRLYENLLATQAAGGLGGLGGGLGGTTSETLALPSFFIFDHQPTAKEVKDRYKRLSSIYHPDRGGDVETMQEINNQYQKTLKRAA